METQQPQGNELGILPVWKLLVKFSVPGMISLLVNSLYNIVDQVFIGQGVGYLGNGATNVAFPFVTLSLAVSLLISDGCAANMSLRLGEGNRQKAEEGIGNALTLSIIVSLILLVIGFVFLKPMLLLFGATPAVLPYAIDYTRIVLFGLPFMAVGITLGGVIRADGAPQFSMVCMLAGAILNTILDPIFIFVFHWGVQGAALATILGQILTLSVSLLYVKRSRHITFRRDAMRLNGSTCRVIAALGISSFITQLAIFVLQIIVNNTVTHYGALTAFGSDIPLTCFGIVIKVNQIVMAFIIGIAGGAQPIIGFNYGARLYDRVKKTYLYSAGAATVFALLGFVVFQFFTQPVINIFGQNDALYNEFALMAFRIVLFFVFLEGFQMVTSLFFQAIGKPLKAVILSLSRQILLLVPLLLILPLYMGLNGALYAFPAADVIAFILAFFFIAYELKHLGQTA